MAAALIAPLVTALGPTGLGLAASTATLAANVLAYSAVVAAQYFLTKAMQPEQEDPGVRGQVEFGEDVPQSIIVGEYATAGSLVYANTWGASGRTPNGYLVQVFCLSDMPVDGLDSTIIVNNKKCTISGTLDGTKGYVVSDFTRGGTDYMWVKFKDGTQTTADSYLTGKFGSHATHPYGTGMIGRGRALAIVTTRYDAKQFSAIPTFLFRVRGIKLYDPRLDDTNGGTGAHRYGTSSTYAYSRNPKVIDYNICRGIYYGTEWMFGGQSWPAYRFDNATWFAAMNECDTTVALLAGGSETKYQIGAEIRLADKPLDVKDRIDMSCSGRSAECGGIYKTFVGAIGASVYSFTDDSVIVSDDRSAMLFPGHDQWVNTIRASYIRPGDLWQPKQIKARTDSAFVTADNDQVLEKTVAFDMVTSSGQAQRLAEVMLNEARQFKTHIVALPPSARKIEPLDVVSWTSARYGYSSKKFVVGEVNRSRGGIIVATLREADAANFNWTAGTDEDAESDAVYGDLDAASDTIAITVTAVSLKNNAGANKRPALKVEWTVDDDVADVKGVQFQVRDATTLEVVRRVRTDDWEDGEHIISGQGILKSQNYQVRARWVPRSDRTADWSSWTSVTAPATGEDDDYTPDVPTGLALEQITVIDEDGKADHKVIATCTALSDPNVDYGFKITHSTKTWYIRSDDAKCRFEVRTGVLYSVQVRAISGKGSKSAYSTAVNITPSKDSTAPAAPTALTLTAKPKGVRVVWDECSSADYKKTRIYRGTTASVGSASIVGRVAGTHWTDHEDLVIGTTYYYWVQNVDESGNASAQYGGVSVVYSGVKDDDSDQTAPTVPTGLAVTQLARDIDNDGRVDIAIKATWTAVTASGANPKAVAYGVKVTQGSDISYYQNDDTSIVLPAKGGKLYSIQVRAISFAGAKSAYSGAVTITPAADTTAPATPSGLAVVAKPRGQRLTWTDASEADYKRTLIYRNTANNSATATLIARIAGTHYLDTEDLTRGTTYYYWIKHRDASGNDSAFSSVVSVAHRGANTEDIEADQITTAKIAPSQVTDVSHAFGSAGVTVGSTFTDIQDVTCNHGSDAHEVLLIFSCYPSANQVPNFRIRARGVNIYPSTNMAMQASSPFNFHFVDDGISGGSTTYTIQMSLSPGSLLVQDRSLTAIASKK